MATEATEKVKINVPVFLFLLNEKNEIYLQRRFQTGFMDGYYEPPAGGMQDKEFPQEAACREAQEEAGVRVRPGDIELFHAFLNFNDKTNPYLGLMFRTRIWDGKPFIAEPNYCDSSGFYGLSNLPEKIIPQVRDALGQLLSARSIELSNYKSLRARLEEQHAELK